MFIEIIIPKGYEGKTIIIYELRPEQIFEEMTDVDNFILRTLDLFYKRCKTFILMSSHHHKNVRYKL